MAKMLNCALISYGIGVALQCLLIISKLISVLHRKESYMQKHPLVDQMNTFSTTTFSDLIASASSTVAATLMRQRHPFFQKKVRGIVFASTNTFDWALGLRHTFEVEFNSLYPETELELETLFVKGSHGEMQATLAHHPLLVGNDSERFSFVLTPGYAESVLFDEIRFMLNLSLPQIYCVPGSLTAHFAQVREGFAGVHNAMMYPQEYLDALRGLIPDLKRVCIAYTPYIEQREEEDMVKRQLGMLTRTFNRANIVVNKHLWDEKDIGEADLKRALKDNDVFITLNELAVHAHRKTLINLCNAYRTPLCASELDTVLEGAALGCGITRDTFAKPMLRVLHHMMFPRLRMVPSIEIPMQVGMRYNLRAMAQQGIVLSDENAALLRMKSVFDLDIISL